jgi:hypothetical protein
LTQDFAIGRADSPAASLPIDLGMYADHALIEGAHGVEKPAASGKVVVEAVPLRRATNARLCGHRRAPA